MKQICKDRKIVGYSKEKKAGLVQLLLKYDQLDEMRDLLEKDHSDFNQMIGRMRSSCEEKRRERERLRVIGEIDAIIKTVGRHPDHAGVQEEGCGALWNLAANNDVNQVEIAKQGGIDVIIKALVKQPDHAKIQEWGCCALMELANNAEIKQEIIKKVGEKYLK